MWLIRPPHDGDIDALHALARSLGAGMTTFPAHRDTIAHKVERSVASFAGRAAPEDAQYLLVLEDTGSGHVLGISAVYPRIGDPYGFFSYHIDRLVQHSEAIGERLDCRLLSLSNAYTGFTEVGTLAVHPSLRRSGAGRALAKARYLLMACFPGLFAPRVIAELRGWQDTDGRSPFWTAVGERFFRMDFARADLFSATEGAKFIAELMPRFPIYLDLLPEVARDAVGKPHDTSAIAMAMLRQEGFRFEGYVDVFDAGPQLAADLYEIVSVRESIETVLDGRLLAAEGSLLLARPQLNDFAILPITPAVRPGTKPIAAFGFAERDPVRTVVL